MYTQRPSFFVVVGPDDSQPNGVTTNGERPPRPLSCHSPHTYSFISSNPFHLGGSQDRCGATYRPTDPVKLFCPHRHPSLVLLPLPLPLFLSFLTLRKKPHPGSRWASFSTSSASLSGRGLRRIQAPLVGLTSCSWSATSGATAAVLESIPLQTNDSWPRETAPHAPPRSHLMRPPGRWNFLTWSSSVRPSRPGAPSLHRT